MRLPAYVVNGSICESFEARILSISDNSMVIEAEGRKIPVEYYFIPPTFAPDAVIADASVRNMSTLFIHEQFILDGMSDSQLEFVMRDGAYRCKCPVTGESIVNEIYSWVQIGPVSQYSWMVG